MKRPIRRRQREYIDILFMDCGFDTIRRRNDYLKQRGYSTDLDSLDVATAAALIAELRERKDDLGSSSRQQPGRPDTDWDDPMTVEA